MTMIPPGTRKIVVHADGTVLSLGFETGAEELVYARPGSDVIVVKEQGSTHWASRGTRAYSGAEYYVYRVVAELPAEGRGARPGDRCYLCERIVEFPVRATREALLRPKATMAEPTPA